MSFAWLLAALAVASASVLIAAPRSARTIAAAVFVALTAAVALNSPPVPLLRVLLAFIVLLSFLHTVRFALARRRSLPWRLRLWQLFSLFNVADARVVTPSAPWPLLRGALLHSAVATASYLAIAFPLNLHGHPFTLGRLALGATLLYSLLGFLSDAGCYFYALQGIHIPCNQRAPLLADSLADFWGRRWNRFVSAWLQDVVFRPLARRHHPLAGLLAAFAASAALHAWAAFVPLGFVAALQMGSYFLIEGMLLLVERRLAVGTWPRPAARIWTILAVVLPSPLGIDPFLRTLSL